jgi:hypothetical protein
MSIALIVWVSDPPRPSQNEFWWRISLVCSGSTADAPRYSGPSCARAARTKRRW